MTRFNKYMAATFPGLSLGPGLFYRWTVGIRLELGVDGLDMAYDDVVMHRACALYEAVFRPGDWGFVVSGHTRYLTTGGVKGHSRYRRYRLSVFKLSDRYGLGLRGPAGRGIQVINDGEDREVTTLRWTTIAARAINYRSILKAIANGNYYRRRRATSDRVYFVNQTRNIILHMYDDRGMDLIAPDRGALQAIYDEHKSWILDYDRKRISETFE